MLCQKKIDRSKSQQTLRITAVDAASSIDGGVEALKINWRRAAPQVCCSRKNKYDSRDSETDKGTLGCNCLNMVKSQVVTGAYILECVQSMDQETWDWSWRSQKQEPWEKVSQGHFRSCIIGSMRSMELARREVFETEGWGKLEVGRCRWIVGVV